MANYVDGYLIPIKKRNLKSYRKMAAMGCKLWVEYGALHYYECVGNDLKVHWGITFPRLCKLKTDETVVFAFIVFKSKTQRNRINTQVMQDPRLQMEGGKMPFDMQRFAMGGFNVLVQSKNKTKE